MYEKVLVPLDGSRLAEIPLNYAKELVTKSGAELILLHVCGPEECHCDAEKCWVEPMHQVYIEHKAHEVEQHFKVSRSEEVKVNSVILCGDPADQILQYANENHVSLILMATHGRSGIRRWIIGSVADKVTRCSVAPVRLCRAIFSDEVISKDFPEEKILVLLDGSKLAENVLPYVVDHAKMSDAEVTLLRVYHLPIISVDDAGPISQDERIEQQMARHKELAEQYLTEVKTRLEEIGLDVKVEVLMGNPAHEIVEFAGKKPFNLIVMATHGRSGLTRWAYGSVADRVLHGLSNAILLVRPH